MASKDKARNEFAEGLGKRIKHFRTMNKITQRVVADTTGKSDSTVRAWENGDAMPDVGTLAKLADLFSISVETLTGVENDLFASPLTAREQKIILCYRSNIDIRDAIDELIDSADNTIPLYTAASSAESVADAIIYVKKSEWERICNAPETDDTLL